jgi:hypothetical protein
VFLLFPVIIAGCDLVNVSLVDHFLDHSEIVKVTGVTVKTRYAVAADGTLLIPPGGATKIGVELSNPRNFTVRQELLGAPQGKDISSRQTGSSEIEVTVAGAAEGDDYELTLAMQSPDGLRDFPPYTWRTRCVSFETALQDLTVNGVSIPSFDPLEDAFRVYVPYSRRSVALGGTTEHPEAAVELYAGVDDSGESLKAGGHTLELSRDLEVGDNHFYFKITDPSSTTQGYAVTVYRASAAEGRIEDFYFTLGTQRYGIRAGAVPESGSMNDTAIVITVPYGTDTSAMTASVNHTGASIDPDPAGIINYAHPVAYTVTAAIGTSETYVVQVMAAKITSIESINGNLTYPYGFANAGQDISGDIKAAITSVAATDSLGTAITLGAADYSVDALSPVNAGVNETATLRVPADRTSTGADIANTFTVYIQRDAKAITAFYFTIDGKRYGAGDGVESGSGSISGDDIAITVPYGTDVTAMTAEAIHTGASISPNPATATDYTGSRTYTVKAEDGTTRTCAVTVNVAKIASVTAVNGNFTSPGGFASKGGADISGDIKAAITSVAATDSLGTVIALGAADYSVDSFTGAIPGSSPNATVRVPADRTSAGADITNTFTVYIQKDAKAITAFYFTIDGKHYGAGTGPTFESGSGTINGMAYAISVTLPYGTVFGSLSPVITVSAGASVNPASGTAWGSSANPHTYRVTAEDGACQDYTVTVTTVPGITIGGITVEGLYALTFSGAPASVTPGEMITITISEGVVDRWYIEITGPAPSTSTANTFTAPLTPGFYNINVIARVGGIDYSGSFGLTVQQ